MNASQLTIIINILVHNKSHKKVHNILCQEISFTLLGFLSLNRTKNWFGDADQYFLMFFQFLQGIAPQGSDDIYGPKFQLNPMKFQKGHLISKRTFSSTEDRCASTYKYTNAVPQAPSFNNDGWKEYEIRIRRYAQETCPGLQQQGQPILFLLTGTSSVGIQQQLKNPPQPNTNLPVGFIGDIVHGTINIPNSMWTAACCVHGQQTKSFAVIGNNVNDKQGTLTQQVTVKKLQDILQAGTYTLNTVTLFPGNMDCADETNNVLLPERWRES